MDSNATSIIPYINLEELFKLRDPNSFGTGGKNSSYHPGRSERVSMTDMNSNTMANNRMFMA